MHDRRSHQPQGPLDSRVLSTMLEQILESDGPGFESQLCVFLLCGHGQGFYFSVPQLSGL